MHKKVKNRILTVILCVVFAILGVYVILYNLEKNITFFLTPSQISNIHFDKELRLGGLVKSIEKIDIKTVKFVITDNKTEIEVYYQGILPALFRKDQGIVALGVMQGDVFIAKELLIKHDENYRPPNID